MRSPVRVVALGLAALVLAGCALQPSGAPPQPSAGAMSPPSAAAEAELRCPSVPAAPRVAGGLPRLRLPCLGPGPAVRLSDLRGPLVLNVWAAWCVNCKREMRLFRPAVRAYAGKVTFLGIHYKATPEQGRMSERDFGVPFPSWQDTVGDRVVRALRATAPPQTFFVDAKGRVTGRHIGEIRSAQQLDQLIAQYLGVSGARG